MQEAQLGDRVRIQYSRLRKHVAKNAEPRAPKVLEFTVGSIDIIPSVSLGVVGMAPGDRKQFTLEPQESGGRLPAGLARQKSRRFPKHMERRVGKRRTAINAALNRPERATFAHNKSDTVLADGNYSLAGETILLEVMLISLDSSANANENLPQFDLGGEG